MQIVSREWRYITVLTVNVGWLLLKKASIFQTGGRFGLVDTSFTPYSSKEILANQDGHKSSKLNLECNGAMIPLWKRNILGRPSYVLAYK